MSPIVTFSIKPLEWLNEKNGRIRSLFTGFGWYEIRVHSFEPQTYMVDWVIRGGDTFYTRGVKERIESVELAKATAQADWSRRLEQCLKPVHAQEGKR